MVYFNDIVGNVTDVHPPFKCTVTFVEQGTVQRALLMSERLIVDGRKIIPGSQIQDYLHVGSSVRFCCHEFDTAKDGMYDWFITNAWRQHKEDHTTHITDGFLGLYNCVGKMSNLAKRQGVLVYTDHKEDRKCWENMKAKRKQELAQEKRQRMATGGGPFPGSISTDDSLIDAIITVDIEMSAVIDSDTLALVANKSNNEPYILLSDGSLGNTCEEELKDHVDEEVENFSPINHDKAIPRATREEKKSTLVRESDKRLARCDLLLTQDKELHALRMKEMAAEMALEMEHMKQKHDLELEHIKQKNEFVLQMLKKKLSE